MNIQDKLFFMFVINAIFTYVVFKPKKIFGLHSLYLYEHAKLSSPREVKKVIFKYVLRLIRPFLTRDFSNICSLYLFVNITYFLLAIGTSNDYVKNVSYSIIGAVIFQYFIIMLPNERKKLLLAPSLMSAGRTLREREKRLFEVLNLSPTIFGLMSQSKNEVFLKALSKALSENQPIGELKNNMNVLEPFNGGLSLMSIKPSVTFIEFINLMFEEDAGSYSVMRNSSLDYFGQMAKCLGDAEYSYRFIRSFSHGELYAERLLDYFKRRQQLILEYQKTAANYMHEHDEEYLLAFA